MNNPESSKSLSERKMKFRDILPWKVELEKQHGPQPTSTPRPFKFTKRKDSKRVNKLDISTPFAFQHVAQACPDDRMSVHS